MNPIIGGALIDAGASLLGGLFGMSGQKKANDTNVQLAREQREWTEDMWNKQNAYNTPAAQIQRMREAGLNPALMYGQGNSGTAEQPRAVQPATVQPITGLAAHGLMSAGDAIADAMYKSEQVKQMKAQTKLLEARAQNVLTTTPGREDWLNYWREKVRLTSANANYLDERGTSQYIFNIGYAKRLSQQERYNDLQNTTLNQNLAIQAAMLQLNAIQTQMKVKLTYAQVSHYRAMVKLMQQKYNYLETMNPKQVELINYNIGKLAAEIPWIKYDHMERYVNDLWRNMNGSVKAFGNVIDAYMPDSLF